VNWVGSMAKKKAKKSGTLKNRGKPGGLSARQIARVRKGPQENVVTKVGKVSRSFARKLQAGDSGG